MSTERHPLSNQSVSGADKIVQILADQGVDTLFGYSGGDILPVFDAFILDGLKFLIYCLTL